MSGIMSQLARYDSLKGKSVVITGGASGIGASMVEHFHRQGAHVFFLDVDEAAASSLLATLARAQRENNEPLPVFHACDVTDTGALQETIRQIGENGGIHTLINNAANDTRHDWAALTPDEWDAAMAINLKHQFFASQAAWPFMKQAGGGSIICLGSIAWLNNTTGMVAYTTAKAGIHGLVRTLARLMGTDRIRVNALLPGWTMTARQKELWVDEAALAEIAAAQCLPDLVMPEDIARMALFLASDESRMCTRQCFIVDGGWV